MRDDAARAFLFVLAVVIDPSFPKHGATEPAAPRPSAPTSSAPQRFSAQRAPLGRLLRSEIRWVLRRPRTLAMLGLFALMPILMALSNCYDGVAGAEPPDA